MRHSFKLHSEVQKNYEIKQIAKPKLLIKVHIRDYIFESGAKNK